MPESIVITAQTTAAAYKFALPFGRVVQFTADGFVAADAVNLQVKTTDGTYDNALDDTGAAITLATATGNTLQVVGPFIGQLSKGVTAGSVGVLMYDDVVSL